VLARLSRVTETELDHDRSRKALIRRDRAMR
jgi:hypothetical protein